MKKFEKPGFKIAEYNSDTNYGHFVIEPLERGFGTTLGNALRSLQAAGLQIQTITDTTPIPHNGCRPPKRPRG